MPSDKLHCITHFRGAVGEENGGYVFCHLELDQQGVARLRQLIAAANVLWAVTWNDYAVPSIEVVVETSLDTAKQAVMREIQIDLGLGHHTKQVILEMSNIYTLYRDNPDPHIEAAGYSVDDGYAAAEFATVRHALDTQTAANKRFYYDDYFVTERVDIVADDSHKLDDLLAFIRQRVTEKKIAASGPAPAPGHVYTF
jgi:hypothetical protein